ncbi:alcohol oxidase [Coniochaeta sp. PMI_546]|nr:alcohol oxidase [Coniochaeta sp. PMI_546]
MFSGISVLALLALCGTASAARLPSSAFGVPPGDATYDYVVIGGGTAGASVGIIEAGGAYELDNGNQSVVPGYAFSQPALAPVEVFPPRPLVDWSLVSQPQTGAAGRKVHYAAGKTLGGTSALNTLAYNRGTKGSYQKWATIVGSTAYTWDNFLKYFIRSSELTPPDFAKRNTPNATFTYDTSVWCTGKDCGPLQVSYSNWVDPSHTWVAAGLKYIGLNTSTIGHNSGILQGGAYTTETIDPDDPWYGTATRSSSESSYLRWAIANTQLMVHYRTSATKVLFASGRASAVSVSTEGYPYTLTAKKEIILSAGTFHSPQLLMVSGIGPAAKLSSLGIPVISDLAGVGQNLQDQIFFSVQNGMNTPSGPSILSDPAQEPAALQQYLTRAAGPYSSAGGYIAFEKLPDPSRTSFSARTNSLLNALPADVPEVEYLAGSFAGTGNGVVTVGDLSAAILNPFSRGNVTISSADANAPPLIDMGWLTDPADAEVAVAAFKRLRQAWAAPTVSAVKVGPELRPGSAVQTDAQILQWIRENAIQIWHACGTNAMGSSAASGAVVGPTAKVFGVDGLRVVDASVIPFALPGHPQATIYALAEKIADDILNGR